MLIGFITVAQYGEYVNHVFVQNINIEKVDMHKRYAFLQVGRFCVLCDKFVIPHSENTQFMKGHVG